MKNILVITLKNGDVHTKETDYLNTEIKELFEKMKSEKPEYLYLSCEKGELLIRSDNIASIISKEEYSYRGSF